MRALFIVPLSVSGPPVNGGQQRTRLIFDALKGQYDVEVMIVGTGVADMHRGAFPGAKTIIEVIHQSPVEASNLRPLLKWLPQTFAEKVAALLTPRRAAYERDNALEGIKDVSFNDYDLIVGRYLRPTSRVGALAPEVTAPVIVDIDDRDDRFFESRLKRRRFNPLMDALNKWHARQARDIMAEKLPRAKHLWLVNDDRAGIDHASISMLPNIPFHPPSATPLKSLSTIIVFVGIAANNANWDGIVRFLKNCWPQIYAAVPQSKFKIAGAGWDRLPKSLRQLPGVETPGFVDDLDALYAESSFAVAPVYDGAGTKIKIVEALSYGRPVVSDQHALFGIDEAISSAGAVSAADDKAMIAESIALLNDLPRCQKLGADGHEAVLSTLTRARFEKILLADCARILGSPDAG